MVLCVIARPPTVNRDELHIFSVGFVSPWGVHILADVQHAAGGSGDRGKLSRKKIADYVFSSVAVMNVNVHDGHAMHRVSVIRHRVRSTNCNVVHQAETVAGQTRIAVVPATHSG